MFQYAYETFETHIIEDTGLINLKEAVGLWKKYYPEVVRKLRDNEKPQMVIWQDCDSETDYNKEMVEISHYDCVSERGTVYKISKQEIKENPLTK